MDTQNEPSLFGNPVSTLFEPGLKDPGVTRSDDWDFPTNLVSNLAGLGQVHRGTPWQTLYLKSANISANTWVAWSGNLVLQSGAFPWPLWIPDPQSTHPTNDWHLAGVLVPLLSSVSPPQLLSVNQPGLSDWCRVLDGMTVWTNSANAPEQLTAMVMTSNSPQANAIAGFLNSLRSSQPKHRFTNIGTLLATRQLSLLSPWLNPQYTNSLTDAAYEAIPSQLLLCLRPDSLGSARSQNGLPIFQFSGADGWRYAVQQSSNLATWQSIATNSPASGVFSFTPPPGSGAPGWYYRSVLLP